MRPCSPNGSIKKTPSSSSVIKNLLLFQKAEVDKPIYSINHSCEELEVFKCAQLSLSTSHTDSNQNNGLNEAYSDDVEEYNDQEEDEEEDENEDEDDDEDEEYFDALCYLEVYVST